MFRATKMRQGLSEKNCDDQRRIIVEPRANYSPASIPVSDPIQLDAALPSIKLLATGIGDPDSVGSAFAALLGP